MSSSPRRVHLAAHFPGVNNTTIWSDPRSESHIAVDSFIHMAQTAERGLMDFLFLAEGLRLREMNGKIYDLDVMGRPDTLTVLSAVAGATERIGLAGTLTATFHEPYELARQFATLDHLSAGRAAWNVVTSPDAFTGENFRRGGYLPYPQRYERAEDFIDAARTLWESWPASAQDADDTAGAYEHRSEFFDISGRFDVPRSPQVHPVIFQAGDSDSGREFAAGSADVIFTRHSELEDGKAFYKDTKGRLAKYGRAEDDLRIYPGVSYVLGDTDADAAERAREQAYAQHSGATAIATLERVWNTDLSSFDPDGPLPDFDPVLDGPEVSQGRVKHVKDPVATAQRWREIAQAENLSIRDLVVRESPRFAFVGSADTVAQKMNQYIQERAADGFILIPTVVPGGLDEFVDTVIPRLQEMGVYPDSYTADDPTLRATMELNEYRPAATWSQARTDARAAATTGQEA